MKKVKVNSKENRYHYIPGDYVLEVKLTNEQVGLLFSLLKEIAENHVINGFEFAVSKLNKKVEAVCLYGNESPKIITNLNKMIMDEFGQKTKLYCIA